MRVKTVPRQRVIQSNVESVFEARGVKTESTTRSSNEKEPSRSDKDRSQGASVLNGNQPEGRSNKVANEKEKKENEKEKEKEKETSKYSEKVLDMSIKLKIEASAKRDSVLFNLIAGPSCRSKEEAKKSISDDDNNNILKTDAENPSAAGSSKARESELTAYAGDESDKPIEALNLCKRDFQEEEESHMNPGADERLKDTFLYKIMTDPTFLESIQKHKQTKRYACPYCKQEFNNSDELADHSDAKKDESNQVVCCACKKTFAQKRYLRYHQRCHSERTMFTCDICTKKYTRIDNLSRHNAFHVNPDKFSCTYCEKTFARKDLLNKHLKCHDNKFRFFCEICQRYFKGPLSLDNHRKNFHLATRLIFTGNVSGFFDEKGKERKKKEKKKKKKKENNSAG
ncbi:unnamed protein product [Heterotrigona itama]|uniref:C2H2-type domain-containing protein n=1 Tax=Heterotrigona itama TaxID=395501 RepID=A0A6V7HGU3_9HYME|nr:unnamed protein product [Heterotrigona itama]